MSISRFLINISVNVALLILQDCSVQEIGYIYIYISYIYIDIYTVLSIRFKVGGYLGMAPAGVILEVQNFFSLENF